MKQFLVIGLGNFGYYLATHLCEKGHEVMAIDKNSNLIQAIMNQVTRAVVADATDARTILKLGAKDVDIAVVSIGSILGDSILTVLNLQEVGIGHIIAKAMNDPHRRILEKLGVKEIVFPERDIALSVAARLDNPHLIDYLPFMKGHGIIELCVPKRFVGKPLKEINMTNKYGVQVVAVKQLEPKKMRFIPTADFILKEEDILILLGPDSGLESLKNI